MNKILKVILNILLVAASIAVAVSLIDLIFSIQYANRETEIRQRRMRKCLNTNLNTELTARSWGAIILAGCRALLRQPAMKIFTGSGSMRILLL